MGEGGGIDFDITASNLKAVLDALKEIDPKLATSLRRQLRQAGTEIIAAQRALLANRPPRIAGRTKRLAVIRPKNGSPYLAFRVTYHPGDTRTGGVPNLREKISAGLKTRVIAGQSRQSVEIRSTGPTSGGANMARVYQARVFRHPVFGRHVFAAQHGQPYFFKPVTDEMRNRMLTRVDDAIQAALRAAT